jgi:hypothetical protein
MPVDVRNNRVCVEEYDHELILLFGECQKKNCSQHTFPD